MRRECRMGAERVRQTAIYKFCAPCHQTDIPSVVPHHSAKVANAWIANYLRRCANSEVDMVLLGSKQCE